MSGSKVNNFSIGDSNIQSVMLTLDKAYKGLHQVSLTNYDNTSESQIAAGSVVENNGALYTFNSNESITGSPSDGTVYIRLVPSGDTITAEYTNTAPTWSDSKQGWYGTGADVNKRYIEFLMILDSTSWVHKRPNLNKSYVRAFNKTDYTVNGSVNTLITFEDIQFDYLSEFSAASKFTAKYSGLYIVNFTGFLERNTSIATVFLFLRKNGDRYHFVNSFVESHYTLSGSVTMYLLPGDYIELQLNQSSIDSTTIYEFIFEITGI